MGLVYNMVNENSKKQSNSFKRFASLSEIVFLMLTGLYLIRLYLDTTTFHAPMPAWFDDALLYALASVALIRLVLALPGNKQVLAGLPLACVYCLCYRTNQFQFLLYLAALTVGFSGISYRKILKTFLMTVGVLFCVTIIAGMTGTITNLIYVRVGEGIRSAWGICYPTDFASIALFLALFLWVEWQDLPDAAMLLLCLAAILLARFIAHSNTSFICGIVFFGVILFHAIEVEFVERRSRCLWLRKGSNVALLIAFPLFALAMFGLMYIYSRNMNIGYRINNLLSDRLKLSVNAWQKYGLRPFGKPFNQYGNGFSTISPSNYNFVDSTYPLVLIRYGWIPFVAMGASWTWSIYRAIKAGNRRLALAMAIIAFHAFSEHHFTEVNYNILLAMPLAAYTISERQTDKAINRKRVASGVATAVIAGGLLWLAAPALLSRIKTVYSVLSLTGGKTHAWTVICTLLALVASVLLMIWAIYRLICRLLCRERVERKSLAVLAACLAIILAGYLYSNTVVADGARKKAKYIDADSEALSIITEAASGDVYAGLYPELYKQRFPKIKLSALSGAELARVHETTTLMSAKEYIPFVNTGCLYTRISDQHAVYTSDRSVIRALTDAGYHLTGYYNGVTDVDLEKQAQIRKLGFTEENGVELKGKKHSLTDGPYKNLFGGKYTVTFELNLPADALDQEGTICKLRIRTEYGKNTLLEKTIRRSDFDDNGELTVSMPFTIGDTRYLDFWVRASKENRVNVRRISYCRTPDYDVHTFYDGKMRVEREETYTREGEAVKAAGGYYSCEYEYDRYNNRNWIRYYDRDDNLVITVNGYAEIHREFDAKKQIIREEYYDADNELVLQKNGYAINEREYDADNNIIVQRFLDVNGSPVLDANGRAEIHNTFDKEHHVLREELYGTDGNLIMNRNGLAVTEMDYDERGNQTDRRYYDDKNQLTIISYGYAELKRQYNGMNLVIRESYYDEKGNLIEVPAGYALVEYEYDDYGNRTILRYYDAHEERTIIDKGYAEIRYQYNEKKQIIREDYYGTDGLHILNPAGHAATEMEYDENGNQIVRRYYGTDGKPKTIVYGYSELRRKYDENNRKVREEYYGLDGEAILLPGGYSAIEIKYLDDTSSVEIRYDLDGNVVES